MNNGKPLVGSGDSGELTSVPLYDIIIQKWAASFAEGGLFLFEVGKQSQDEHAEHEHQRID